MKIVVLAGGLSPERNVSLSSGSLISAALRRRGHRTVLIDVYKGIDIKNTDIDSLFSLEGDNGVSVGDTLPDLDALVRENGGRTELVGEGVVEVCHAADSVFLALHGAMGENGQLQAFLDIHSISYTGSGYVGSTLAMDKDIAKKIMQSAGVLTPVWERLDTARETNVSALIEKLGLPMIIKPCSCGSSVGVFKAHNERELVDAINEAKNYERFVMAEQMIEGRELTCAFLDGKVLPPVEIIPKQGFYDYKNKYMADATVELCPAPLSDKENALVAKATEAVFYALRLDGYARIDYILDRSGKLWCLEANTLPGMTPTSLLPKEAAAVGIEYDELCEKLAGLTEKSV